MVNFGSRYLLFLKWHNTPLHLNSGTLSVRVESEREDPLTVPLAMPGGCAFRYACKVGGTCCRAQVMHDGYQEVLLRVPTQATCSPPCCSFLGTFKGWQAYLPHILILHCTSYYFNCTLWYPGAAALYGRTFFICGSSTNSIQYSTMPMFSIADVTAYTHCYTTTRSF